MYRCATGNPLLAIVFVFVFCVQRRKLRVTRACANPPLSRYYLFFRNARMERRVARHKCVIRSDKSDEGGLDINVGELEEI